MRERPVDAGHTAGATGLATNQREECRTFDLLKIMQTWKWPLNIIICVMETLAEH